MRRKPLDSANLDSGIIVPLAPAVTPVAWDPNVKAANITLSNNNLDVELAAGYINGNVIADTDLSGKKYWRVQIPVWPADPNDTLANVGIQAGTDTSTERPTTYSMLAVDRPNSWTSGYLNGPTYYDGPGNASGAGDTVDIAYDDDANLIWWRINGAGNWNQDAGADPVTGTGGHPVTSGHTYRAHFGGYGGAGVTNYRAIFKDDGSGSAPTGFDWYDASPPDVYLGTIGTAVSGSSVQQLDITTYTVAANTNRVLVAALAMSETVTGLTATWDNGGTNQAMFEIGNQKIDTWTTRLYWFGLVAPTTGNHTLRFSWTTASNCRAFCFQANAVDQTGGATSFADYGGAADASTSPASVPSITLGSGDMGISGLLMASGLPLDSRSHTLLLDTTSSQPIILSQYASGVSGPTVMSFSDANWSEWGVNGFRLVKA